MLLVVAGIVYGLFAIGCFRLAAIHDYEMGVSVGEGMFTSSGRWPCLLPSAGRNGGR